MEKYFGITYEFDKQVVLDTIDQLSENTQKAYICVADGVTLAMSQNYRLLREVLAHSAFNVCDSGWVPLYLRWIYGIDRQQYSGSELFNDVVGKKKYNMMFLGTSNAILKPLRERLAEVDGRIADMSFVSLPFRPVEGFDYDKIAAQINEENPDIIWVSLGMPKQEIFMYYLLPKINAGTMIGVGAAFKFMSGLSGHKRAPQWMVKCKMEWIHRIFSEPKKQIGRCWLILKTTPRVIRREYQVKKERKHE